MPHNKNYPLDQGTMDMPSGVSPSYFPCLLHDRVDVTTTKHLILHVILVSCLYGKIFETQYSQQLLMWEAYLFMVFDIMA